MKIYHLNGMMHKRNITLLTLGIIFISMGIFTGAVVSTYQK